MLELTGERTLPGIPSENYWYRRHVAAYRLARRLARGRVVDAGAGEGYGAAMLARRASVVGLELDPLAVAHAAARYPSVRFVPSDLCHLPLAAGSVDAVVALQVLEHLYCADRFVASCRHALRPGGVLILSTPNRPTFPGGLNPFHVYEYDREELEALLRAHFDDVEVLGIGHRLPLAALDRLLAGGIQRRLVQTEYPSLPWWLRAVLSTVTSRDFRVTRRTDGALDLVGICRTP